MFIDEEDLLNLPLPIFKELVELCVQLKARAQEETDAPESIGKPH